MRCINTLWPCSFSRLAAVVCSCAIFAWLGMTIDHQSCAHAEEQSQPASDARSDALRAADIWTSALKQVLEDSKISPNAPLYDTVLGRYERVRSRISELPAEAPAPPANRPNRREETVSEFELNPIIGAARRQAKESGEFAVQMLIRAEIQEARDLNARLADYSLMRYQEDAWHMLSHAEQELVVDAGLIPKRRLAGFPKRRGASKPEFQALAKNNNAIKNSIGMWLVEVPAGTFRMGVWHNGFGNTKDAARHTVKITTPHYFGAMEVTQEQFARIMGKNPSQFSKDGEKSEKVAGLVTKSFPVNGVSWTDAMKFCLKLSKLPEEKDAGRVYRLPTEAEWEYACRAGGDSDYYDYWFGSEDSLRPGLANWRQGAFNAFSLDRPTHVGSYRANRFGLFDVHGNVAEWCADWYDANYYKQSTETDPRGPEKPSDSPRRVIRGGAYNNNPKSYSEPLKTYGRRSGHPTKGKAGFRVVCEVGEASPHMDWQRSQLEASQ